MSESDTATSAETAMATDDDASTDQDTPSDQDTLSDQDAPVPDPLYGPEEDKVTYKVVSADNVLFHFTHDDLIESSVLSDMVEASNLHDNNEDAVELVDDEIEVAAVLRVLLEAIRVGTLIDKRFKGHPLTHRIEDVLSALRLAHKYDFQKPYVKLSRDAISYMQRTHLPDETLHAALIIAANNRDLELAATAYASVVPPFRKMPSEVEDACPPDYAYALQKIAWLVKCTKPQRVLINFETSAVLRHFKRFLEDYETEMRKARAV